jgi:hypothetical protein
MSDADSESATQPRGVDLNPPDFPAGTDAPRETPPSDATDISSASPGSISAIASPYRQGPSISQIEIEEYLQLFNELFKLGAPALLQDLQSLLIRAPRAPLVTKESMRELDIESIVNNPKLRRDINFELRLAFRPTETGGKQARLKLIKQEYIDALAAELEITRFLFHARRGRYGPELLRLLRTRGLQRVRKLLATIKDILETMITESDLPKLRQHFDIELRVQQITHGCMDFIQVTTWLGRLLKTHCAPVRDSQIDQVVKEIEQGDIQSISSGLVSLLEALENMKLDIANHQVRHLKAYFVNWTFPFEIKYHGNRIKRNRFDPFPSRKWFLDQQQRPLLSDPSSLVSKKHPLDKDLLTFIESFILHIFPTQAQLPDSFDMDSHRVRVLRSDLLEILQLMLCYHIFLQYWVEENHYRETIPHIPFSVEVQILGHMRAICSPHGVANSTAYLAQGFVKWVAELKGEYTEGSTDQDAVEQVEEVLRSELDANWLIAPFSHTLGDPVPQFLLAIMKPLILSVCEVATSLLKTDYFEIFKRLVPQPPPTTKVAQAVQKLTVCPPVPRTQRFSDDVSPIFVSQLNEVTNRLAHIAILHWKVWSPLVYLNDEIEEGNFGTAEGISRTVSPMPGPLPSYVPGDLRRASPMPTQEVMEPQKSENPVLRKDDR